MKQIFSSILLCAAITLIACDKDKTEPDPTVDVTGVTLSVPSLALKVDETKTLTATVTPDNATNRQVVWNSADKSIATVSPAGVVRAVGVGNTTITATSVADKNKQADCPVTVAKNIIAVTGIALDVPTLALDQEASKQLKATITPEEATNQGVVWRSDDLSIATVDQTGVVTGVKGGTTKMWATSAADESIKAPCTVTVSAKVIAVTEVKLDQPTLSIEVEQIKTLKATITPDDATNQKVEWSSDDKTVATVDQTGAVTGVKGGTTKIWATSAADKSIKAPCTVTVSAKVIAVTEVKLDQPTLSIEVEQVKALKVTVTPDNATDIGVEWKSADPSIATVSKTGNVTGVKVGTTTITVTSTSDNTKWATCKVSVAAKGIPATDMWAKTEKLELQIGASGTIVWCTIPTNATNQNVVWTSDDESVATVDAKGVITGVKAGTTNIWVRWAGNPEQIKDKCVVTVLASDGYAIGDLYPNANNPVGVVFWKDPEDAHGAKIISFGQTNTAWATTTYQTKATDTNDGAVNLATIKAISAASWTSLFPAFAWCANIGEGWYLPAENEAMEIYKNREAINGGLSATKEGVALPSSGQIWTSTEKNKFSSVTFLFSANDGTGAAGTAFYAEKGGNCITRAIKKISF